MSQKRFKQMRGSKLVAVLLFSSNLWMNWPSWTFFFWEIKTWQQVQSPLAKICRLWFGVVGGWCFYWPSACLLFSLWLIITANNHATPAQPAVRQQMIDDERGGKLGAKSGRGCSQKARLFHSVCVWVQLDIVAWECVWWAPKWCGKSNQNTRTTPNAHWGAHVISGRVCVHTYIHTHTEGSKRGEFGTDAHMRRYRARKCGEFAAFAIV